ncbi:hypothetical protein E2C01_096636 [Portunus trituberculatus]|uniref:Uncharacterized protein n=1 Tax=Portunus trituberculatus TaxID=210409 RepID=A0A5B7JYF6_PORTR|nr:hypothetical protein [Portunus trituberculatus]
MGVRREDTMMATCALVTLSFLLVLR